MSQDQAGLDRLRVRQAIHLFRTDSLFHVMHGLDRLERVLRSCGGWEELGHHVTDLRQVYAEANQMALGSLELAIGRLDGNPRAAQEPVEERLDLPVVPDLRCASTGCQEPGDGGPDTYGFCPEHRGQPR